jgi:hypothetical protein
MFAWVALSFVDGHIKVHPEHYLPPLRWHPRKTPNQELDAERKAAMERVWIFNDVGEECPAYVAKDTSPYGKFLEKYSPEDFALKVMRVQTPKAQFDEYVMFTPRIAPRSIRTGGSTQSKQPAAKSSKSGSGKRKQPPPPTNRAKRRSGLRDLVAKDYSD